jgi:hypothetical protein
MRVGERGSVRAGIRTAAGALALASALSGCWNDPEPFPYASESLAVLPVHLHPYSRQGATIAGDQLTAALQSDTTFRVVPAQSVARILSEPSGRALYERFRTQALGIGAVSPELSLVLAQRVAAGGLLFTSISAGLRGGASGDVAVVVSAFEATTGYKVWTNSRRRAFVGAPGEPAFVATVGAMIREIVDDMPRPRGEEP